MTRVESQIYVTDINTRYRVQRRSDLNLRAPDPPVLSGRACMQKQYG
jgi:hypothetical protein